MEFYKNEDFKTESVNGREVLVPEDWEVFKLGELGKISMCKRILKNETSNEGDVPFYKIGTFGKEANAYITEEKYREYKEKFSFPKKGELLISASGTIGRIVVYDGKDAYFQDSNIVWISNSEQNINNNYLRFLFKNIKWSTEKTTIDRLYNDIIKKTEVFSPSLEEQTKIATVLTNQDELIDSKEKLIIIEEKKKTFLQQEILSGRLRIGEDGKFYKNIDWRTELVNSKSVEVPEEWEVVKVDEIIDFKNGKGHEQYISNDGEFIVVNSKFVSTNGKKYKKSNKNLSPLIKNDIVFVMSDLPKGKALAKTFLINENNKFTLNQRIGMLRAKKRNIPLYLFYSLNRNICFLRFDNGVGQTNLKKNDILLSEIAIPNKEEQNRIATVLTKQDEKIETLKKDLEIEKKKQKFLQQELLSGRIRIKETK